MGKSLDESFKEELDRFEEELMAELFGDEKSKGSKEETASRQNLTGPLPGELRGELFTSAGMQTTAAGVGSAPDRDDGKSDAKELDPVEKPDGEDVDWVDPLLQADMEELLAEQEEYYDPLLQTGVMERILIPEEQIPEEQMPEEYDDPLLQEETLKQLTGQSDPPEKNPKPGRRYETAEYETAEEPEYEEAEESENISERLVAFFRGLGVLDYAIGVGALLILVLACLVGGRFLTQKDIQEEKLAYQELGTQTEGMGERGAAALRQIAAMAAAGEETAEEENPEDVQEQQITGDIPVEFKLSTIQSDLKIKFLNADKNALIADAPFTVEVRLPGGGTESWTDDDWDGVIYRTSLGNGTYEVTAKAFEDESYERYLLPQSSQSISVTDQIAYKKVDVSDEIKKESEVNVAAEDTAKKNTVVESKITDTVEWVESTKTEVSEGGFSGTGEGYEEVSKSEIEDPKVSSLNGKIFARLSASAVSVSGSSSGKVGESLSLTADITDDGEGHGDISWESDNTGVASVSGSGSSASVSLKGAGTAVITVRCDDASGVFTVNVSEEENNDTEKAAAVTGISLSSSELSGQVGETKTLTAEVSPSDAGNKNVSWSSSDNSIAAVESGKVTLKASGTAQITARTDDGGYEAVCRVTVSAASDTSVTGISLDITSLAGTAGTTASLKAEVSPSTAANKNVKWSSDNTSVVKVSDDGKVEFVSQGTAVITVETEDGGKKATCSVTVSGSADASERLKDKNGEGLYVKDGDSYREALKKDYNSYSVFYRKVTRNVQYKYTGWQTLDGKTYFFDKDGNYVTGDQIIQGISYHFGSDGVMSDGSSTAGIDVSKWNGSIDWTAVKSSGIGFAIIRCGYRGSSVGSLIEDSAFRTNISGAKKAGLKVGVYFFSQAVTEAEAVEEASMVLSQVSSYGVNMPIFLDVEASGGRGDQISAAQRTKNIRAFCQTIQNSGYSAGVYANTNWFTEKINVGELTSYHIWLAQYAAAPTYSRSRYDIWQYSSTGKVNGISGNVDMDIAYRSY